MKPTSEPDRLLRELANRYVELEGARLRDELQGPSRLEPVPAWDRRPRSTGGRRLRRSVLGLSCAAACLLAALLLPGVFFRQKHPSSGDAAPSSALSETALPFTLPVNLTVSDVRQDRGQTIYYLTDAYRDDVVLAAEKTGLRPDGEGLTRLTLGGYPVYARRTGDYQLLLLEKDGTTYTMTCRYELETLFHLGQSILGL